MTPAQIAAMGDIVQQGSFPSAGEPTITSDFGARSSPGEGASSNHPGIDIASRGNPSSSGNPGACPIIAPAAGTVSRLSGGNCPYHGREIPEHVAGRHDTGNKTGDGHDCGGNGGNIIYLDHGNGLESSLMHCHSFAPGLAAGQTVTKGQILGSIGSTGNSYGPHIHFEWKINGTRVDPQQALGLTCNNDKHCAPGNQNLG
jgi:murein DD-endopeptidase MepM/ murein hydrolase activator NlpD